jgi:hypothetical protein
MSFDGAKTWFGIVNEDGSYSILSRITSLDGTGDELVSGEGNCIKQADLTSITVKIFDLGTDKDNPSGEEIVPAATVSISINIFDTLRTSGWDKQKDQYGYNFRHDLSSAYCPDAYHWYQLEYKFTTSTGGIIWNRIKVNAIAVQTS